MWGVNQICCQFNSIQKCFISTVLKSKTFIMNNKNMSISKISRSWHQDTQIILKFKIYSTYKIITYDMITPHVYFFFVFFCVFQVREGRSDAISPLMHRMYLSQSPFHPHTWPFTWSSWVVCEIWFSGPPIPRGPSSWLVKKLFTM